MERSGQKRGWEILGILLFIVCVVSLLTFVDWGIHIDNVPYAK